jgi:hypothetical protein
MVIDRSVLDYVGDIRQLGGLKRYEFDSGWAKGVQAIDVDNGTGLQFTVLVDRGFDIGRLSFRGTPLTFMSGIGVASPQYYNERGEEWLRTFGGGFLTTCGFDQVGEPCELDRIPFGLHGRYSALPSELIEADGAWVDNRYVMTLRGRVRQARHQGENFESIRQITCVLGENRFRIEDSIRNLGNRREPLMLLYHLNFGYPLLNPSSEIVLPSKKIEGWDAESHARIDEHLRIDLPTDDARHRTYLHTLHTEKDGSTGLMVCDHRDTPKVAIVVYYDARLLHTLGQWKYLRSRDYIMALEPCNNRIMGVAYEHDNGSLRYIEPDECVKSWLEVQILTEPSEIASQKALFKKWVERDIEGKVHG